MKKIALVVAALLLATAAVAQSSPRNSSEDRKNESQLRSLQGQVMGRKDAPLPEAVVYLKNTKTLAVRTFIANQNGEYQFNALAPNVDYELYAEYNGKKSDTKTLSAFDNRAKAFMNIKIDTPGK
jgi:protocatechuate 3,4-dioxygenase beta subunit